MSRRFNGTNQRATLADISSVNSYTVSIWAALNGSVTANHTIAAGDDFPTAPRCEPFLFQWRNSGSVTRFEVNVNGTGAVRDKSGLPGSGEWHHYLVTRNGTTAKVFYDGTQVGSNITVGSGSLTFPNMRIGNHFFSASENEHAPVDAAEFTIWDVDLNSNQIIALANRMHPYRMRNGNILRHNPFLGVSSPEVDYSGNKGVATLVNSPTQADHVNLGSPFGFDNVISFPVGVAPVVNYPAFTPSLQLSRRTQYL
jgi:hypothetical protein